MSFNGNKMITTSGGGALICPGKEAKERIMFFCNAGTRGFSILSARRDWL